MIVAVFVLCLECSHHKEMTMSTNVSEKGLGYNAVLKEWLTPFKLKVNSTGGKTGAEK